MMLRLPLEFLVSGAVLSPKPGRVWLAWGDWKWESAQPLSKPAFFTPDFFLSDSSPWGVPEHFLEMEGSEFLQALESLIRDEALDGSVHFDFKWDAPDREAFEQIFGDLQERFASGSLSKAVPVVFERATGAWTQRQWGQVLVHLVRSLLSGGSSLRLYGLWGAERGILGATPEDLFEMTDGGWVKTMALAGTRGKPAPSEVECAKNALLNDPKERREHQWVIDDICKALSDLGEVRVGATQVLELPSLLHLKTPIEIQAESVPFEELVRRLHPTAALGAFPREEGWRWLLAQDSGSGGRRERFGAPFGVVLPERGALCLVAIRNIQWDSNGLRLGAGCGVIRESVCHREWDELSLKRQSVKRLMGL